MGINCEKCLDGYFRPRGYSQTSPMPCRPCNCRETATSTSRCVPDDSRIDEGLVSCGVGMALLLGWGMVGGGGGGCQQ